MSLPVSDPVSNVSKTVKVCAIVLAIIVVFGMIGYLEWTKSSLEKQLATANTQIGSLQTANDSWADQAKAQNAAIDGYRQQAEQRAAVAAKSVAAAEQASDALTKQAAAISGTPAIGDNCTATKNLFADYFKVVR